MGFLRDLRVRDAEGGREEKERPGGISKGMLPRHRPEDPKALGDQRANGEEARHELSRGDGDGWLNLKETTYGGEFQGEIPVEYNPEGTNIS